MDGLLQTSLGCLNIDLGHLLTADGACVDDDDDGLADGMEGVANVGDECMLLGHEVELGGNVAVNALACLTSDGDDGCVGLLGFLVDGNG